MNLYVQKQSPVKFILTVIGLTAFAMIMTAAVGYLITSPPRGFLFWVVIGFFCTIEFLVGILYVNTFARSRCEYKPSGAILAITYSIIGAFATSGLLSIIVYWAIRDEDGTKDGIFSAVLMAIIVFWFIIAFFLYAYDLHAQSVIRPALVKRAEHQSYSQNLKTIPRLLRTIKADSDMQRKNIEIASKKLESIEVALAHSHGGGVGSWESGRSTSHHIEQNQTIQNEIDLLTNILPRLSNGSPQDRDTAFNELEQSISRLSIAVDAQGLS